MPLRPATFDEFEDAVDEIRTVHHGQMKRDGDTFVWHAGGFILARARWFDAEGSQDPQLEVDRKSLDVLQTLYRIS